MEGDPSNKHTKRWGVYTEEYLYSGYLGDIHDDYDAAELDPHLNWDPWVVYTMKYICSNGKLRI